MLPVLSNSNTPNLFMNDMFGNGLNRFFDQGFINFDGFDIWSDSDNHYISVDMPGWQVGEVELTGENNMIQVKAEGKRGKDQYLLTVPDGVDYDRATALLQNGVLKITLPKLEIVKPKKIQIMGPEK
jgi:HSP20 family protein